MQICEVAEVIAFNSNKASRLQDWKIPLVLQLPRCEQGCQRNILVGISDPL